MKDLGRIRGSEAQAQPLVIGKNTVYVHANIEKVEGEENLYEYNEKQYTKDEYIKVLSEDVTSTQMALCEVYELLG